jgi:hypothetical protein
VSLDELTEIVTSETATLLRALEALDRADAEIKAARAFVLQAAAGLSKPELDDARIAAGMGYLKRGATLDALLRYWPWLDLRPRMIEEAKAAGYTATPSMRPPGRVRITEA